MGWKQWSAVAVVIGGGILLQIPGHEDTLMDHAATVRGEAPADMRDGERTPRTLARDRTGLTSDG